MNHSVSDALDRTRPGFRSFKCPHPIRFESRIDRDLMIQASLDRHITQIVPTRRDDNCDRSVLGIVTCRAGHNVLSVLVAGYEAQPSEWPPEESAVTIRPDIVTAEPALSSARQIWSCNKAAVPARFAVEALAMVKAQPGGIAMELVHHQTGHSLANCVVWVSSLACAGRLALDYRSGLSPDTMVRPLPDMPAPRQPLAAHIDSRSDSANRFNLLV